MDDLYRQALLFDFYSGLLTEKQQNIVRLHLQEDWSLGEISEALKISRQGVSDSLHRGLRTMEEMESKLHMASRFTELSELTDRLEKKVKDKASEEELIHCIKALRDKIDVSDGQE